MNISIKQIVISAIIVSGWSSRCYSQNIPMDPALRTGKLANGFTYYIRHNEEPKKRVELYLVNKVGSILEDEDQLGLAHFMEHMNFNGTKHFPKNDLVAYLQKAGVRFGADINAFTSFDETVYQLPIPLDDTAMLGNGMKIMRDWAQEATLDPIEIDKERGVVLEEERLGKGAADRMSRLYLPFLLNHARFADRLPIGRDSILTRFKPETIRRFFHDWYRPDLQALIIVGDINVDEAEKMVKTTFADLKNPARERERIRYTLPLSGLRKFLAVTDKEASVTNTGIMMIRKSGELKTEQDYMEQIKKNLFNELINTRRYAEQVKETNPAYTDINTGINTFFKGYDMFSFNVAAKEGKIRESFEQGWRIIQRLRNSGFTKAEFDRVKTNYLSRLEAEMKEQNKIPSINYVNEYQGLFLNGTAAPGITWEYRFIKTHIGIVTLEDMTTLMNQYFQSPDVDILITAPDKVKDSLPDLAAISAWVTAIGKEDLVPYKEEVDEKPLLAAEPTPGKVISTDSIPQLGITQYILNNGVKVVMKPTTFKNDEIIYSAFRPGGALLYEGTDYLIAANAGGIIAQMGYGNFNPAQLAALLTGKIMASSTGITSRSEIISGSASSKDLETALKVTYLQFTAPRKDLALFNNLISNTATAITGRSSDPGSVFSDTINYVLKNYDPRYAPLTMEKVKQISLDRTYAIYKERFSDATGFTFFFVGNFDPVTIKPLLEKYLGGLPSLHKNSKAPDPDIHEPEGKMVKKVYKGKENKALVKMCFGGRYVYDVLNNLKLKALCDILQIKVLQHLREDQSEVYSPEVLGTAQKYPEGRWLIKVSFGCAPKNVDHLTALVELEMKTIRENGPQPEDIDKFKASYEKGFELAAKENGFWLSYLSERYANAESVLLIGDTNQNLGKLTQQSLKDAAVLFFSGKNLISFELLPE
ncbi:M16 family metallopeptidase [Flavitalea flava]